MRELKFRTWNWLEGRYDKSPCAFLTISGGLTPSVNRIVEQYTGLKDKNGKEIYEGDVVKYTYRKDYIGQVAFGFVNDSEGYYVEKHYGWGIYSDGSGFSLGDYADDDMRCELVEVIGNIHENPELLEEEEWQK